MNAIVKASTSSTVTAISDDEAVRVLGNSLYPGARPDSIRLVLAWCKATGRDPMKKPIHIVPMWVKDAVTGQGGMRDVLMPGIGTYRTDAATTGQYAGKGEPEFGPDVTGNVGTVRMTYPKWCKITVQRSVGGQIRSFTALEFWLENYATAGRDKDEPNAMWRKRPYAQLAKCAESQALRMAFPDETGNTNTQEEMEGKTTFDGVTLDASPESSPPAPPPSPAPKRTGRDVLNEIRADLIAATTPDDVHAIAASETVTKALGWLKNGALDELNSILADALARFDTPHDEETGEVEEPEFPGDR